MSVPAAAPLLVLAWGNPSRGDDGLGPALAAALAARLGSDAQGRVDWLEDFQLQVEHCLDLVGRRAVLLVDASRSAAPPFEAGALLPAPDRSIGSHALSPAALLQVYREVQQQPPPPCTLLAVRGASFALGDGLSALGRSHLAAALDWAEAWLQTQLRGEALTD